MDVAELRQAAEESCDLPSEPFPTPEWPKADGHLFLRGITADEHDAHDIFLAHHVSSLPNNALKLGTTFRARVAAMGLVNESGERVFSHSAEHLAILGKKGPVVERAYDRVRELSGMTVEESEELEKNSETATGDSSPTT